MQLQRENCLLPQGEGEQLPVLVVVVVVVDLTGEEELVASEGSCTAAGGELLPSPGGR